LRENSRNTRKRKDVNNSRNANNSMILNIAGKSATSGRLYATAGTSGAVDNWGKLATGIYRILNFRHYQGLRGKMIHEKNERKNLVALSLW
jgi:hypothetical protein